MRTPKLATIGQPKTDPTGCQQKWTKTNPLREPRKTAVARREKQSLTEPRKTAGDAPRKQTLPEPRKTEVTRRESSVAGTAQGRGDSVANHANAPEPRQHPQSEPNAQPSAAAKHPTAEAVMFISIIFLSPDAGHHRPGGGLACSRFHSNRLEAKETAQEQPIFPRGRYAGVLLVASA